MKKLMYILPHCSTGGMPQYVVKQIESFKDQFEICVVEVNNYSNEYVVQRNKIAELCELKQLNGNKGLLINYINEKSPDIIHFQEVPDDFLDYDIVAKIYRNDRPYNILVTSHSSLTKRSHFKLIPDKLIAVNRWQQQILKTFFPESEVDIWEYPIENKIPTPEEKDIARGELEHFSFSTNDKGKHILNVGLFTPGKNQVELFEIAKKNPQNHYHFVGNMAENFRSYWEPLLKNRPENCYLWGERDDVETFYKACDEFYFTSRFELNPIVIKEALSYGLKVTMRKLPTYLDDYDNNPLVTYYDIR